MAMLIITVTGNGNCDHACDLWNNNKHRESSCNCFMLWDYSGIPTSDCPGSGEYLLKKQYPRPVSKAHTSGELKKYAEGLGNV
jgi:hypothetical protein